MPSQGCQFICSFLDVIRRKHLINYRTQNLHSPLTAFVKDLVGLAWMNYSHSDKTEVAQPIIHTCYHSGREQHAENTLSIPGSVTIHTKYRYLFSLWSEFFLYHDTGANGRNVAKGATELFQRGPFLLLRSIKACWLTWAETKTSTSEKVLQKRRR